jgi:hypothetical protein
MRADVRTDRHDEPNSRFSQILRTRLAVDFLNIAKAPNKNDREVSSLVECYAVSYRAWLLDFWKIALRLFSRSNSPRKILRIFFSYVPRQRTGEGRDVHSVLVGKPEGTRPLGRPRR